MTISIAMRLKPFSHVPGISCLIPKTPFEVVAYPAKICIWHKKKLMREFLLDVKGPLREFTLMQDLERGCVTVSSECYHLHVLPNLEILSKKKPLKLAQLHEERLSLGSHKKQEWETLKKRCDFHAIFPLWHRLGMQYDTQGEGGLLDYCAEKIAAKHPEKILDAFRMLFLAGFRGLLVPRMQDDDNQGIFSGNILNTPDEMAILSRGARLIRSLFIQENEDLIAILPRLPPEFFAGRMTKIATKSALIDLEWSKKEIRRVNISAAFDGVLNLSFRSSIKTFRLRLGRHERGKTMHNGDSLEIKSGAFYLLDQFHK